LRDCSRSCIIFCNQVLYECKSGLLKFKLSKYLIDRHGNRTSEKLIIYWNSLLLTVLMAVLEMDLEKIIV
jgi:hypothetical protein